MATTTQTNDFRRALLEGGHNFKVAGIAYKMLLIKGSGSTGVYDQTLLNVGTPGSGSPSTSNVGTDEASATGYTSGGVAMGTNTAPAISSNVATTTWASNPSWTVSTSLSTICGVIFTADATIGSANRTVGVFDFGGVQTATGTLTVVLPTNSSTLAIIRIA